MKIGIPRALLYYWYGHQWSAFWQEAGVEVVVSPNTTRQMMMAGVQVALDELCLPIKIFLGHVQWLASKVDRILVPHIIKIERDAYICPKFMGLPDLVIQALPEYQQAMLILKVGPYQTDMNSGLKQAAAQLGIKSLPKLGALSKLSNQTPAETVLDAFVRLDSEFSQLTIGLLGHPYSLYDSCFNLNLLEFLAANQVKILTPELLPDDFQGIGSGKLNKPLFWSIGRRQFDAFQWMVGLVDGFIYVTPFACGPEAIVGDLVERKIREAKKPLLHISFEEHTGEAGMITRLEAFLDLIKYQRTAC